MKTKQLFHKKEKKNHEEIKKLTQRRRFVTKSISVLT